MIIIIIACIFYFLEVPYLLQLELPKIEYGKAKSIPLDTLEKICLTLDCEIGDLLVLVKVVKNLLNVLPNLI
ncbi:helix-turn-helix domain-containing protein [uncultured Nostoc sp.]|uniref:helix-turn-helix domain-containing protein n=1 Tax=uncultured Nostoc sp. TaxID=340711 RepID=UPI0035CC6FF8